MSKPLASIPIRGNRQPQITGQAVDLSAYLKPINDPEIATRLGDEREVYADATFRITHGEAFRMRSATMQGMRYMYLDGGEIVGCLNVTRIGSEVVASNIVVREDMRARKIATSLVQRALEDFPRMVADDSMSIAGAALFGRLPPEVKAALDAENALAASKPPAVRP